MIICVVIHRIDDICGKELAGFLIDWHTTGVLGDYADVASSVYSIPLIF